MLIQFIYNRQKSERILQEVDDVLRQQVSDAKEIGENVQLDVILMTDVLRFSFSTGMQKSLYEESKKSQNNEGIQATVGDGYSVNATK